MPLDAVLIGVNQHALLMNLDYVVFQDREIYPALEDADAPLCTHHRDLAHIYTGIIPDFGLSGGTAVWMADYLDASEIIIAGCDNYTGGRRYWHSSPNQRADMQGVNPADVWRMVRSHLQHPERVKVCSGPLTEVFTCA
ncbi:MAG: hypothetical protein QG586_584 [Pseudomonadota bacterium]|nr:hypothetical protein [Pseudomonadota bacterium]